VRSLILLLQVERPVGLEIAAGAEGPEAQHSLGTLQRPTSPGAVHAVLDEMAACALDDTRCDGEPIYERAVVVQERVRCFTR
jgi:hypothetical protein